MKCSYTLTEAEFISAMIIHGRGSNLTQLWLVIAGIILLLISTFTSYIFIPLGIAILGCLAYFGLINLVIPYQAQKQFKKNKILSKKTSLLLTEQGINLKNKSGEKKLQWQDIKNWKCDNGVYLLYLNKQSFHTVPVKPLPDQFLFDKLLLQHLGKKLS
ncbi:MAG: hypothetical protein ACI88H_003058 [Cocleimonas sp.]|jgi:hypothetical protein